MIEPAETQYALTSDGLHIAYQSVGEGPQTVLFVGNWFTNVEAWWVVDSFVRTIEGVSSFARFVFFDQLGSGLSDPVPLDNFPGIERWADSAQCVLDAVGLEQAFLMGVQASSLPIIPFAAAHPERVSGLILINPTTRSPWRDELPANPTTEDVDRIAGQLADAWGTKAWVERGWPDASDEPGFVRQFTRFMRMAASPKTARAIFRLTLETDVTEVLSLVRSPTLVFGTTRPPHGVGTGARAVAEQIADAHYVELSGTNLFPVRRDEQEPWLAEMEEFVTGSRPRTEDEDRVLATVLFTDICDSTQRARELGDRRWRELLDTQDRLVRSELDRHKGRFVKDTGDGVLAIFDGPARAVRCALAIIRSMQSLGIDVRAGLHTGEIERRGEDIGGIAVHIGQRVSAIADPSQVLVSRTVTDLVAGSGLEFEDCGEHQLKGLQGTWPIYAVRS